MIIVSISFPFVSIKPVIWSFITSSSIWPITSVALFSLVWESSTTEFKLLSSVVCKYDVSSFNVVSIFKSKELSNPITFIFWVKSSVPLLYETETSNVSFAFNCAKFSFGTNLISLPVTDTLVVLWVTAEPA